MGIATGSRRRRGGIASASINYNVNDEIERNYYTLYGATPPKVSPLQEQFDDVGTRIGNAQMRIAATGNNVPEYAPKTNKFWQGVQGFLDVIDRPRNAVVNAMVDEQTGENTFGQGFMEGLTGKEHAYTSELLEQAGVENKYVRGIAGFVGDVVLDPTTYMTLGVGSLAKGIATGAGKTLTRETAEAVLKAGAGDVGEQLLKANDHLVQYAKGFKKSSDFVKAIEKQLPKDIDKHSLHTLWRVVNAGEDITDGVRRTLYNLTTDTGTRDALIDSVMQGSKYGARGMSMFGKELVSGATMQDIGAGISRKVGSAVNAVPGGQAIKRGAGIASRAVNNIFSPMGDKLKQLGDTGKMIYQWERGAKGMKNAGIDTEVQSLLDTFKPWIGNEESLDKVRKALENSEKYRPLLSIEEADLADTLRDTMNRWGLTEKEMGVMSDMVKVFGDTDYLPHVANWDERNNIWRGGKTKQFSVKNWHNFTRKHQGTIDEINEKLANIDPERYGEHYLETNLAKILVDRAVDNQTVIADKTFVDRVLNGFGKKVTGVSTVDDGQTIVVPRQAFKVYQLNRGLDLPADKAAKSGKSVMSKEGVEVTRLADDDLRNAVRNAVSVDSGALIEVTPEQLKALGVAINDLEAYALPKQIVDYVNDRASKQVDEGMSAIGNVIDSFYKLWKPSVTGLNPAYYVRNVMGATWNNFVDVGFKALDPVTQKEASLLTAGKKGSIKAGNKTYTFDEIRKGMREYNVRSTYMHTDTASLRDTVDIMTKEALGEGKVWDKVLNAGATAGNKVEEQVRAVNVIAHLKNGADLRQASEQAVRFHFDYTELTETEKGLLRRAFPFYTWFRKNFPLQLEEMLNNPGLYNRPKQLQQNMANSLGTDMENLPDWVAEQTPIPLGTNEETGRDTYLTASLPYADMANLTGQDFFGMLSPLAKVGIEAYTGQSLLTGAPIEQYPGQTTDKYGIEMSRKFANALDQFGTARDLSNALSGMEPKETSVVTPRRGFADPTFGITREYSPEAGKLSQQYEYSRQLENMIQRLKDLGVEVDDVRTLKKQQNRWMYQTAE